MTPFLLSSFQQLDNDREIAYVQHPSTKATSCCVIRPLNQPNNVPLFCALCELPLKDTSDFHAHLESQCCNMCKDVFQRPNKQQWDNDGWRPSKDSKAWSSYMETRLASWKPRVRLK
jgi:hypothetical protein